VFNYAQALAEAGVRPVIYCTSENVSRRRSLLHEPTGAEIVVFPTSIAYRVMRRLLPLQRASNLSAASGSMRKKLARLSQKSAAFLRSYFSMPLFALFADLEREGCRSVLVQEYESGRFDVCVLMSKLKRIPIYGTFTGGYGKGRLTKPLRRLALKSATGLLICARREADRVIEEYDLPSSKVKLLSYPIDLTVWYPEDKKRARSHLSIDTTAQIVIYHGAIELKVKGLDALLKAWAQVCRERPSRKLLLILIGTGTDASALSSLLAERQLENVEWLNLWMTDRSLLRNYLSSSDVYVFPSREDAFGISVLEAMACGLPIVASDARGIPDIFEGGEESGAIVVPPGDSGALASAIGALLDDRPRAFELGKRSRQRVETAFSMDQFGTQMRALLAGGDP
jgi:glycosyltransferase involved in cell wall biosynthesis